MKRRTKVNLVPPLVALGAHLAFVGLLWWMSLEREPEERVVGELALPATTYRVHSRAPKSAPTRALKTTFAPTPSMRPPPPLAPLTPPPSFTAPQPQKRIVAVASSTSSIQLPSAPAPAPTKEAPKSAPKKSASPPAKTEPEPTEGGYVSVGSVTYVQRGKAKYPAEALRKKLTGTTILLVYVDTEGRVERIEIAQSSGVPSLDAAAITAEQKSRYQPAIKDGKAVKFKARVPYRFQIQ